MTKQIVCQDCGGYGFIRTVHNENSVSARGCSTCGSTGLIDVSLTNADRIRAMSDEELAIFLEYFGCCHYCSEHERLSDNPWFSDERCDEKCSEHCLEWLKQPVGE